MPQYRYKCYLCGQEFDVYAKMEDCLTYIPCECTGFARIQLQTFRGKTWEPYYDRFQGRWFHTERDFTDYCRKNGLSQVTESEGRLHKEEVAHAAYKEELKAKGESDESCQQPKKVS